MNERVIFDAALEIADPQARRAFVEKACAGDPAMLAAVESLLKSHDAAGSFLDIPVARQMQSAAPSNPSEPSAADEKTRTYQPGAIDDDSIDDADSQPDLSFLQPSSKPGSIGLMAHYEILSVLGQGAFGIVFKAFDEKLHRLVAIKVMNPQLAATSPPRKRFLREARAAAAIRHENVVQVYSVEEQPLPYLVMEFIDGQTLNDKLNGSGPLETPEVLHIGRQIASGLAAAQTMGLIHRDIKPANILLEQPVAELTRVQAGGKPNRILANSATDIRVKISDFGLARAADDASMTRTGVISGTPMYMAPEQATGQTLDHRADLFSFGSVLYQMACGRPPFRAANTIAVLRRVVEDTPRPLQEILPEIPDWLVAIVTKLLAKKPEDRFQSAKEVADLLARCQSELQLNGKVTCVPMPHDERSRHAPRDEPNAPSTPISQLTSTNATPSTTPSTPSETSTSTPRSAHHAERDGYVNRQRSNVARYLIAATLITVIVGLTLKPWQNDRTVTDSKSSTPPSALPLPPSPSWHGWPADAPPPAIAPFNADEARQHQEAWAKYLGVPVEYTNSIGMKFRLIPPGEFTMGSTPEEIEEALKDVGDDMQRRQGIQSEAPRHKVVLSKPIYLGIHEVTQNEYVAVTGTNPSQFSSTGAGREAVVNLDTQNHPVEMVSWNDAAEFCAKLCQKEKLKPPYFRAATVVTPLAGTGYRLPTEAEWEFSCRAGTTTKFWFGEKDEVLSQIAWFSGNAGVRTHAVGQLKSNPFGMFDVYGNVCEWTEDAGDLAFYQMFKERIAVDPIRPSDGGVAHVFRGGHSLGGWGAAPSGCRSSSRSEGVGTVGNYGIGFRASLPVDAVRQALKVTGPAMPKGVATTQLAPASDTEKLPAKFTNRLGMEFVLVGKGTAWLGGGNGQQGEKKVEMPEDFYLGRYEVTQAEWEQVTGQTPSHFSRTGGGKDAVKDIPDADLKRFPVEQVSWDDAQLFLARLNKQTQETGWSYRLPKADEREYACRGGPLSDRLDSAFDFYFEKPTNQLLPDQANFEHENNLKRTCGVGQYQPNRLGLYDLHGNVWEWCEDDPTGAPHDLTSKRPRYIIGGGYLNGGVEACRTRTRVTAIQSEKGSSHGLRLARVPVGPAMPKAVATIPSAPALDPIDFAAERQAAEWVLSLGGRLELIDGSGNHVALVDGKLPDTPFAVSVIHNNNGAKVKDDDLAPLARCRRLQELSLSKFSGNGSGLRHLAAVGSLRQLEIDSGHISDSGLQALSSLSQLRHLHIGFCPNLTDQCLTHVGQLVDLEKLLLNGTPVGDAGVKHLSQLSRLRHHFVGSRVTDAGIRQLLEQHPNLEALAIFDPDASERTLMPVAVSRSLQFLGVSSNQITADGLRVLQALPTLRTLDVVQPTTADVVLRIAEVPQLREVHLRFIYGDSPSPGDAAFAALARLPHLERIFVFGDEPSPGDSVLEAWAGIPNLKSVTLHHNEGKRHYTPAGIAKFREQRPDVPLNIDGKDYPATK